MADIVGAPQRLEAKNPGTKKAAAESLPAAAFDETNDRERGDALSRIISMRALAAR